MAESKQWNYRKPRPRRFDFPRRGAKASVSGVAQAVLDRKVPAEAQRFSKILGAWEDLVGSRMAQRSCPTLLRKQLLFVDLKDRQWAHDMRYMQSAILARIEAFLGPRQILALRCRVTPPGQFVSHAEYCHRNESRRLAWREMTWPTPRAPSLPPRPPSSTVEAIESIQNPKLRASAIALRRALSEESS